jgi:hypothetical protein
MKKLLMILAFSFPAMALDGLWEGVCLNLPNNLPNATINYRFYNGQVEIYLQYYQDNVCSPNSKANTVPQAQGSYQILSSQALGGAYQVNIDVGQGPKTYQITIQNSVMTICDKSPYSCWSYTRRG